MKKRLWRCLPKQTSAREGGRLEMLSRLGRWTTTWEFSFDWSAILVFIHHSKLSGYGYIHASAILSLVARKNPHGSYQNRQSHIRWSKRIQHWRTYDKWSFVVLSGVCKFIFQPDHGREGCLSRNG